MLPWPVREKRTTFPPVRRWDQAADGPAAAGSDHMFIPYCRSSIRPRLCAALVDTNLDGHAELLASCLQTDTWRELRDHLDLRFLHFDRRNAGIEP
jgi:hypothetical protein